MLGARQVGEEGQDRQHVDPDEHPLEHAGRLVVGEQMRERVRDRRPVPGVVVDPERDPRRVPQQQRQRDRGDQPQDQVGLAHVRALEALGPHDLADVQRRDHADEDQTAKMSTSSAYQPWWPSHGNVACLSTAPIIAITIVGPSTRNPQKMNAWIRPGTSRSSSLRCPSTIVVSLRTRRSNPPLRSTGAPARISVTRNSTRSANSAPLTHRARPSATAPTATPMSPHLPDLGADRRDDLMQVAGHAVVAELKIDASPSGLIASRRLAPLQPAMCWVAPEIPHAMQISGEIFVPVWPT